MPTIRTAAGKGSELTPTEADANMKRTPVAKNSNYTLDATHNRELHELGGTVTQVTLPTVSTSFTEPDDWYIDLKNTLSSSVTINRNSQNIDGVAANYTLPAGSFVRIYMDAANTAFRTDNRIQQVAFGGTGATTAPAALANLGFATTTLTFSSVPNIGEGTAQNWAHGLGGDDVIVIMSCRPGTGTLLHTSVGCVAMRPDGQYTMHGPQAASISDPDRLAEAPASGNVRVNVFNSTGSTTDVIVKITAIRVA